MGCNVPKTNKEGKCTFLKVIREHILWLQLPEELSELFE